jgi:hypothetical protein
LRVIRTPGPVAVLLFLLASGATAGRDGTEIAPPQLAAAARELGGGLVSDDASLLGEPAVRLPATPEGTALHLAGTLPWASARYLAMDALVDGDHDGEVLLRFFAKGEPKARLRVSLGLFPRLRTRLVLPLSVLDAQSLFLPRTPGRLKAVASGRRLPPAEIDHVDLQLKQAGGPQSLYLGAISFRTTVPPCPVPAAPLVDSLGQWKAKEWPDKTKDDAYLGTDLDVQLERGREASWPKGFCRRGGSEERTFRPTGFFHLVHDGTRWWLVDPEGHGFFSLGLDSVRPGEQAAVVPGAEALFGPLPPRKGPLAEAWGRSDRWGVPTYSYALANLIRSFGPRWRDDWTQLTRDRLVAWRFNTIGNWSDPGFEKASGLPYVIPMPPYPTTAVHLYRDFPDVFAAEFQRSAREYARHLASFRDDANLVGYFMGNEPQWAFGANDLAAEMLEAHPGSATRRRLSAWLSERYHGDAAAWARAWGLGLTSFDQVTTAVVPRAADRSAAAKADLWEFSKEMVRAFVRIPAQECRRVDPNHLNLGLRYAWISSDLLFEGAEWFSVFSINAYEMLPPADEIARIAERTRKPVMIGEFHFGALDRGLPATGLRAVASQAERGVAYRRYVEAAAANPNVVGVHYFVLNDQPVLGRFDGENFQIGFVDVCHRPYRELVDAARTTHERIYDVVEGREKPYDREAKEVPRVGF